MVTGVATTALIFVAWSQLHNLAEVSRGDFIYRLKKDFFTEESRGLLFLLEYHLLEFVKEPTAHFVVEKERRADYEARAQELKINYHTLSTYVIDDLLLGPLEDVGLLLETKLIGKKEAYEEFYTYVKACAEDEAVMAYIAWAKSEAGDEDVYDHFDTLRMKLKKYGESKMEGDGYPLHSGNHYRLWFRFVFE
jgi:hypothetical protein